ncbi:hypothetical protein [Flavobacterium sp. J27]|uniref:hypothetical protein n=1 Tax=Flavobacterium sp. J27 TaxID=2060419 RepID=UPI001031737C|nr:hypothetical protein [Flavobacterium sp. J27]
MSKAETFQDLIEKEARYTTAIESLHELLEQDHEIDAVRQLNLYLKEQRKEVQKTQMKYTYNIPVHQPEIL